MNIADLVERNPHDYELSKRAFTADEMTSMFEFCIDNGMFVLISPDGGVRLYQDPDRPVPLNVTDIRPYLETDS